MEADVIELLVDSIEDINAAEKLTTKFDATTVARERVREPSIA